MNTKDWLSLFGGLLGSGAIAAFLNNLVSKRARLLDAYVELAGAATGLYHLAIAAAFDDASSDEAWLRFGTARARTILQEQDPHCRKEIADLAAALGDLYSVEVYLGDDPPGEQEQRVSKARRLMAKMELVQGRVDQLLDSASKRLARGWKFWI